MVSVSACKSLGGARGSTYSPVTSVMQLISCNALLESDRFVLLLLVITFDATFKIIPINMIQKKLISDQIQYYVLFY